LLQRSLSKDTRERIHDIADARILLEDRQEAEPAVSPSVGPRAERIALSLIALVATAVAVWTLLNEDVMGERHVTRSRLHLEEGTGLLGTNTPSVAISPDGQHIAYVAFGDNSWQLYIRSLSEATAQRVRGSDGARGPFFSDDSRQVAFYANGSLHRVPVSGARPRSSARAVTRSDLRLALTHMFRVPGSPMAGPSFTMKLIPKRGATFGSCR